LSLKGANGFPHQSAGALGPAEAGQM